jgi:hypothetical protein
MHREMALQMGNAMSGPHVLAGIIGYDSHGSVRGSPKSSWLDVINDIRAVRCIMINKSTVLGP